MKRVTLSTITLLFVFLLIFTSCSQPGTTATSLVEEQAPTAIETQPQAEAQPTPETVATATETTAATATDEPSPTPEPTEAPPPFPCMIAFDSDRDGNKEVYLMGPDGKDPVNLSNNPADDWDPSWSPDGTKIAFVSNRDNGQDGGQFIYIMNADGSDIHQLSKENESKYPDWSNDGSKITYTYQGDIYVINADGAEPSTNLTNSPEEDMRSAWSPDDSQIAWLSGGDQNWNIFIMNADGSNIRQITDNGKATDVAWTVDGQIFAHWEAPDGSCSNCVMDADGSNLKDAGGKGSIQQYIPFWTWDGDRVECVSADINGADNEIYLVSEIYPDIFFNLTNNPANDQNPDWPALCGPGTNSTESSQTENTQDEQPLNPDAIVIGYTGDTNSISQQKLDGLLRACEELQIQCIQGESITGLAEQNVDAILAFSNRWHVLGAFPEIYDITEKGTPVFILDAESDAPKAYNLSIERESVRAGLVWMFEGMGGEGEFVYYNFGHSDFHQSIIDEVLKDYPGIQATSMPADYEGNSFDEESIKSMVESDPNLGAIWSNENTGSIFWGVNNAQSENFPLILCDARLDFLQPWKNLLESRPDFKCYSTIKPGGTAYEGVYVAYYILTGEEINPAALGGASKNTFIYDYPIITNENLDEWLAKADTLRKGEWDYLELPPMTPEEIKEKWFNE